jgi:hypothetical protein
VRFKEKSTDVLYDARQIGDYILVRSATPDIHGVNIFSFEEFMERFEESYVPYDHPGTDLYSGTGPTSESI